MISGISCVAIQAGVSGFHCVRLHLPDGSALCQRPEVRWTTMANTSYGRLFKSTPHPATTSAATDSGGREMISGISCVAIQAGVSGFHCVRLHLPDGSAL
jgi:hypothetical protein